MAKWRARSGTADATVGGVHVAFPDADQGGATAAPVRAIRDAWNKELATCKINPHHPIPRPNA